MDITTVSFSLFISSVNVVKFTWKFRKAARQAGMNFWVSSAAYMWTVNCQPLIVQAYLIRDPSGFLTLTPPFGVGPVPV